MFFELFFSVFFNVLLYNNTYSALYNCILITFSSLLKIIFYNNFIVYKLLYSSVLNTSLYYIIDTIRILKNGKVNVFVVHHIISCYILLCNYTFDYNIYSLYTLLFLIELSSISYNLYYHKFINKETHIKLYIPLRIISTFFIVKFVLYDMLYTYNLEYYLNVFSYSLLSVFNIGGILKSLNFI